MSSRTLVTALLLLCLVMPMQRALALSPPVGVPVRGDVAIGVDSSARSQAAMVLVDGFPHIIQGGGSTPLEYTWFDGLIWRSQRISDERLHQAKAVQVGNTLHVAALLSDGDAAPQLHYLALPLRSGVPSRRDVIATNPGPGFALSLNASGTAPILLYQRADRVAWWVTGLGGALNITRATALDDHEELIVHDMVGGRGTLWVALERIVAGVGRRVRVLADPAGGPSFEEAPPDIATVPSGYVARIALANDGSPLLAVSVAPDPTNGFARIHRWFQRSGSGQWSCPEASPDNCSLVPVSGSEQHNVVPRSIALASDTGVGYVALLAARAVGNPNPTVSLWSRRLFPDGSTQDTLRADQIGGRAIATAPPFFDTVLFKISTVLYAGLPSETPWRTWQQSGNTIQHGLSLAADAAGEPVVVADGGPGAGLVRSRWRTTPQYRQVLQSLRPVDERYVETRSAFDARSNLHIIAREMNSGSLYYLRAAPGTQAQRELLEVQGGPDAGIEIAVESDGSVFASWYETSTGTIQLAQQDADQSGWVRTILPGTFAATARPQLALSHTGLLFVSAYSASEDRIRVWQRRSNLAIDTWQLALETPPTVSQPVHDLAGTRDGRPALAYVRQDQPKDPQWIAYRFVTGTSTDPQIIDVSLPHAVPFDRPVRVVQMALVDDSPSDARVLAAHADSSFAGNRLIYARRTALTPDAVFEVTDLGSAPDSEVNTGLGLMAGSVATYAAAATSQQLILARHGDPGLYDEQPARGSRLAPILNEARQPDEDTSLPNWYTNLLAICYCLTQPCRDWDLGDRPNAHAHGTGNPASNDLSHELRQRFVSTPAGLRYLELWSEHGDEMGAMVMQDPNFAAQRITVFSLFLPGLAAFVEGNGHQVRMSSEMLESAAAIWQHFADHGSPALRNAIELELAATNDLKMFTGMSFDQWFATLPTEAGVEPPLFADGFEAR